jgi:exodeoxyribonuclease VII small subunit
VEGKNMTLEESFQELDGLIAKLEAGNIPISESFKLYKDGIKLVENCTQQLDKVEKEIIVLNKQDGTQNGLS